jgi:hypothetical protein
MGLKLDVSAASTTNGFYVKSGTWIHLQNAYNQIQAELGKSLFNSLYDPTLGYLLSGCGNTGSGSNYIIAPGSIFFNGEVYLCDGQTFTISGANVAVASIATTYLVGTNADPVTWTDGVIRNMHQINKIVFSPGLSGSGIFNYSAVVDLKYRPVGGIGQTIEWIMPGTGSQTSLLPTYFNIGTGAGLHPLTTGWVIDPNSGLFVVGYKNGDPVFGTLGATGNGNVTLDTTMMPPHQHKEGSEALYNNFGGGNLVGTLRDYRTDGLHNSYNSQNTSWQGGTGGTDNTPGTAQPFKAIPPFITKLKITRVS